MSLMSPLDRFKLVLWGRAEDISASHDSFTNWSITGVAAIAALIAANIGDIGAFVSKVCLRWSLLLLVLSLISGYVSKFIGSMIAASAEQARQVQTVFEADGAKEVMDQLIADPKAIAGAVAAPFLWPWSSIVQSAFMKGFNDPLFGAKRLVRLNCQQLIALGIHALLAAAGLAVLAFGV